MIIENYKGMTRIFADEGKKITNKDKTFFSDFIYLGKGDSPDKYEEVRREIWKYFITEENPDIKEMQNQIKDLKEETQALKEEAVRLKSENVLLTELLLENDYRISQEINSLKQSK
jgi:predicted RNase H-like nuclease (RuvC/YqgF family)